MLGGRLPLDLGTTTSTPKLGGLGACPLQKICLWWVLEVNWSLSGIIYGGKLIMGSVGGGGGGEDPPSTR